jgi:hypothetical protein
MAEKRDILCGEQGCLTSTAFWRQCPWSLCTLDIGFCDAHGGQERAEKEMRKHIINHRVQDARKL